MRKNVTWHVKNVTSHFFVTYFWRASEVRKSVMSHFFKRCLCQKITKFKRDFDTFQQKILEKKCGITFFSFSLAHSRSKSSYAKPQNRSKSIKMCRHKSIKIAPNPSKCVYTNPSKSPEIHENSPKSAEIHENPTPSLEMPEDLWKSTKSCKIHENPSRTMKTLWNSWQPKPSMKFHEICRPLIGLLGAAKLLRHTVTIANGRSATCCHKILRKKFT